MSILASILIFKMSIFLKMSIFDYRENIIPVKDADNRFTNKIILQKTLLDNIIVKIKQHI